MNVDCVARLAADSRLLRIAGEWLGANAIPFRATLFDKSPDANWLVAWHQDTALPVETRHDLPGWGPWSEKAGVLYAHAPAGALEDLVALRIHLDESGDDNGPLRVLPGTHQRGVMTDAQVLECARRTTTRSCCVPAGGVVAMRPLIVHASSKALSSKPRRVLHVEYSRSLATRDGMRLKIA
jgi:ectoine hydroxylase-related dioxygenase (phytanoyl-CoA dioxygenase family)